MKPTIISAALHSCEIVEALRELTRRAPKREFRGMAFAMLSVRFQLEPTLGQLNGVIFRERIVVQTEEMRTDGAAALARAAARTAAVMKRRREKAAIQREVDLLNCPDVPRMLSPFVTPHYGARGPRQKVEEPILPPVSHCQTEEAGLPRAAPPCSARQSVLLSLAPCCVMPTPLPSPPRAALPPPPPSAERMWARLSRPIPPPKFCCWPIGEPQPAMIMEFCEQPVHPDRPYCLKHCKIAYQGFRENRPKEEATATFIGLFPARRYG